MTGTDSINIVREKITIPNRLNKAGELFEERNKKYGDVFHQHGKILQALFPEGLHLSSDIDFSRFGVLNILLSKVERYCNNFSDGHKDSIEDLIVYDAMLAELYDVKGKDSEKSMLAAVVDNDWMFHPRIEYCI